MTAKKRDMDNASDIHMPAETPAGGTDAELGRSEEERAGDAPAADDLAPVPADSPPLEELAEQLLAAEDRYLRLVAEFDNYRKRVLRERTELRDRAQADLVTLLLEELDDLERLTTTDLSKITLEAAHEAIVLTDRKFRKELQGAGVERIDPVGTQFDPNLHEAVSVLPTEDPALENQVSATFQAGFQFKGMLMRPARVQVYAVQGGA